MRKIYSPVTDKNNFFMGKDPIELAGKFGTPLYVYNEKIIREKCRDLKSISTYPHFEVDYSIKANSNLAFIQIVKSEGLLVDAMSPGEIYVALQAGYKPEQIFYICNNVSEDEMQYAIDTGVVISVDSLSQLETYGKINPGGKIAVRFNAGMGAGDNPKITTAGEKTKFGIEKIFVEDVKNIIKKYDLKLIGLNQHIGSLNMNESVFAEGTKMLLEIAMEFPDLEFIDMGGGYGIPYHKEDGENSLNIAAVRESVDKVIFDFVKKYGKEVTFRIEPGRYISAESGMILGKVHSVKTNCGQKYIGCDVGFNVLQRPVMYDSYHGIEIYRPSDKKSEKEENVKIVGNICESGDILAHDRVLPEIFEGDILGVLDAGAYGFSMSSNYNLRLKPAEILLREDGSVALIRERDTLEDMMKGMVSLEDL
ncbi:MAG: diaminopimelate decarboxylase [Firmicutes bacterium]|nr:diaminopimelate decarboxylase [Bacillota bacterium]